MRGVMPRFVVQCNKNRIAAQQFKGPDVNYPPRLFYLYDTKRISSGEPA